MSVELTGELADELVNAVRADFIRVMPELGDTELDLNADMVDVYGLSSLNKVLFLTSVCDSLSVSLATFTELDLAAMRTLGDVVDALAQRRPSTTSGVPS